MRIVGIETSCDETAVAVVEHGTKVLCNVLASSQASFAHLAGVIPEEAARKQLECMLPVFVEALDAAKVDMDSIDAIAVTRGPGLLGSLLVGTATARMLSLIYNVPIIGVHHTLGHLSSTWLDTDANDAPVFPIISLSASGGHTDLWYRTSHTKGFLLGRTRDDAAGEAFDKGASILGLPYPGGPSIAKAATKGDVTAYSFPLPLRNDDSFDFSFSGLKTSLKYLLRDDPNALQNVESVAASFEHAIALHLTDRLKKALDQFEDVKEVHLVGGVSANTHLRDVVGALCEKHSSPVRLRYPLSLKYCTDNAAMIAAAGYVMYKEEPEYATSFTTDATLPLEATITRLS